MSRFTDEIPGLHTEPWQHPVTGRHYYITVINSLGEWIAYIDGNEIGRGFQTQHGALEFAIERLSNKAKFVGFGLKAGLAAGIAAGICTAVFAMHVASTRQTPPTNSTLAADKHTQEENTAGTPSASAAPDPSPTKVASTELTLPLSIINSSAPQSTLTAATQLPQTANPEIQSYAPIGSAQINEHTPTQPVITTAALDPAPNTEETSFSKPPLTETEADDVDVIETTDLTPPSPEPAKRRPPTKAEQTGQRPGNPAQAPEQSEAKLTFAPPKRREPVLLKSTPTTQQSSSDTQHANLDQRKSRTPSVKQTQKSKVSKKRKISRKNARKRTASRRSGRSRPLVKRIIRRDAYGRRHVIYYVRRPRNAREYRRLQRLRNRIIARKLRQRRAYYR